ncbi:hypothetical protein EMCRGX_G031244 [Ephydatia muelleri]
MRLLVPDGNVKRSTLSVLNAMLDRVLTALLETACRCGNTIHGMCTERQAFVVSLVLKPFHVKVYTRDICEMRKQYGLKEIENPLFQSQQMYIGICQLKCCTLNCYILVTRQKYTLSTLPLKTITGSQTTTLGALQLHDSQFDIRLDELTTSDTVQEFKAVIFKDSTGRVHQTSHSHDQKIQFGCVVPPNVKRGLRVNLR